jgi:hypothetical protein
MINLRPVPANVQTFPYEDVEAHTMREIYLSVGISWAQSARRLDGRGAEADARGGARGLKRKTPPRLSRAGLKMFGGNKA